MTWGTGVDWGKVDVFREAFVSARGDLQRGSFWTLKVVTEEVKLGTGVDGACVKDERRGGERGGKLRKNKAQKAD